MKIYKVAIDQNKFEKCPQEYGFNLTSDRRVASVDWNASDLYGGKWTEKTVKAFLGLAEDSVVYKTLADIQDLDETLVEEEDDIDGGYDWSELQRQRTLPPPIVITRTKNDAVIINDGNHRTRYFKEIGKQFVPCWCYDEKITEWIINRRLIELKEEDLDNENI